MTALDPRAVAQERFAEPDVKGMDIIERCATDVPLVVRGLVDAVRERVGEKGQVIELGFGSGWLLEALCAELPRARLYGIDLSPGVARRAHGLYGPPKADVRVLLGDMERLPFRNGAFDVVVTCWTLYFMRDIDAALAEIKRCLRPGGRLIAAASAPDHEAEANDIVADAVRHALGRELSAEELDVGRRFDLETGAGYVGRHFPNVELREWRGEMVLSRSEVTSLWKKWEPALLDRAEQEAVRTAFMWLAAEQLQNDSTLRIRRREGAFVCDLA